MNFSLQQIMQKSNSLKLEKKQIQYLQEIVLYDDSKDKNTLAQPCLEIAGQKYIREVISCQSEIWKKNVSQKIPEHLQIIGYQFMTECYQILIKRLLLRNKTKQYLQEMCPIVIGMIESINKMFLERERQIENEEGVRQTQYKFCWLTLANELWNQHFGKKFQICDSIIDGQVQKAGKLIEYFLLIRRENSMEQSPIFSEDSFNPQVYQQKMKARYQWYRLEQLLSDEQLDKMRARIMQIRKVEWRQRLLKDLEDNMVLDLSISWND